MGRFTRVADRPAQTPGNPAEPQNQQFGIIPCLGTWPFTTLFAGLFHSKDKSSEAIIELSRKLNALYVEFLRHLGWSIIEISSHYPRNTLPEEGMFYSESFNQLNFLVNK